LVITKEQLKERMGYLGGSDAAAILGLSRWGTPLQVYMAKVFPNRDDSETKIGGKNEAARWGLLMEDVIAQAWMEDTGKKLYRVNETLIHPDYDFVRANIDRRVVGENVPWEGKNTSAYKKAEWQGNDDIPQEALIQGQHYLSVFDADKIYYGCCVGGNKLVKAEIGRDEELIKTIIDAEVHFWNEFVLKKQPPPVTGSERDGQLLARLYPDASNNSIVLPDEFLDLIQQRQVKRAAIKEMQTLVDEIENKIKAKIGENKGGVIGNFSVTWANQTRTSVDTKALKEKHPDIFQSVQKTNSFRVLRIAEIKKEK